MQNNTTIDFTQELNKMREVKIPTRFSTKVRPYDVQYLYPMSHVHLMNEYKLYVQISELCGHVPISYGIIEGITWLVESQNFREYYNLSTLGSIHTHLNKN